MKKLLILSCLVCATFAYAQDKKVWSLDDCIQYAKTQNLTIQKAQLSLQTAGVSLDQAKAAYWPTLSFGAGGTLRYMPFTDPGAGLSSDGTTLQNQKKVIASANYGLNLGWTVWNGSRQKSIDQAKVEQQISQKQVARTENEITESIMQVYMRVQYAQEGVRVSQNTLAVQQKLLERAQAMKQAGTLNASELAQVQSQYATDQFNLVSAETNYETYLLQLKQLLEMKGSDSLHLAANTTTEELALTPLPAQEDVYRRALQSRPEIQSNQLAVQSAELGIDKAKAGYMPSISLSAGSSITHSSASSMTLAEQLKDGWSNSVGLNLNVPILDQRQTKSSVEKARITKSTAELTLLDEQKTLYKTIETLWLDANSSQKQYLAARAKCDAAKASYELIQEQFRVGVKHATDLAQAEQTYLNAQQELLQAKYMAAYSVQMLQYYNK